MKTILCSVVFCFMISLGFSQFQHTFGTEKSEVGRSLTQLRDVESGYLIAGYTSKNYFGSLEATLVKTDLAGNQVWSRVYGGQDYEYFNSVRQSNYYSPNNKVAYVAAGITRSYGFGGGDAYLLGVDVNGVPVFSTVYGRNQYDIAHCVQNNKDVTGKPGYILVGETRSYTAFPGTNIHVVKTDIQGNLVKATVIGGHGDQRGMWIEQTKDGGYIIAGSTTNYWCGASTALANPPTDLFVIKLKPDLTMEWNRIFGYPKDLDPTMGYRNVATCVKQNRQGNYVLTGYTNSFGINNSHDAFLLFLDGGGNFLGMKTYGTERTELGASLEETFDSNGNSMYTVVGQQAISTRKAIMFQTDAGGTLLWARQYGKNGQEGGLEMVTDKYNNGFAFTGYTTSLGAGATDIYLVETTDTGKTGTICELKIDLKEIKQEPCVTKSAQQIFVDEYRRIDSPVKRIEYPVDFCGKGAGFKAEDIKMPEKDFGVALFPNPVNNLLTLNIGKTSSVTQVEVFDMQGKMVMHNIDVDQKGTVVLSTEALSPGVYIAKIKMENGKINMIKFLKK
ncbi:T9SS type A sorting domain-containing protein [Aquimarina sediminis]|uniref:T9SS type A sorting domain-containing protein n=1 Tax=Aquimarina sediminis TaxID=2070536 RepID=UPI000CA07DED|nr:T9SS type A sorting domain-containing protein [Aquimarina sediminis]